MNALFYTPEPGAPRVALIAPELRKLGHGVRIGSLPLFGFGQARESDVVLLHQTLPGGFRFGRLRRAAKQLIFDMDRTGFLVRGPWGVRTYRPALSRFARIVGAADLVTTTNQYLAAHARKYTDDWRVKILPEAIDLNPWPARERGIDRKKIVVGWMGDPCLLPALQDLTEGLRRLCDLFDGLELRIVSDAAPQLREVRVNHVKPDPARLVEQVSEFDIALALYSDDAMSMGETPRELLAYLAAGLPIVASDAVAVRPIIRDHQNGLLALSPEEWERKIGLLIEAPDLAVKLAAEARRTAEKVYAVDRVARGYASVFESLKRLPVRTTRGSGESSA